MAANNSSSVDGTAKAALIWLCLAGIIALILFIVYSLKSSRGKKKPARTVIPGIPNEAVVMRAQTAGGVRRRPRTARQRMMTRHQYDDFDDDNEDDFQADLDNMGGSDEDADLNELQQPWKDDEPKEKIGTKKQRKLQEKALKKEQRELQQKEREERKKQEELKRKEKEEEEELLRLQEEKQKEEEMRLKEEQERREHEEYLLLKEAFTVEDEGEAGVLSEQESQALLQEFIDFVKERKVVTLEELAAQFDLRVQEAIKRLEDLQEMGRLTGVMDDRGKFIYISQQELEDVARYVKQRGRIAITELAEASSTLISLKSSEPEINSKLLEVA